MSTNDFQAKGYGQNLQWLPPFALIDNNGNTMFAVNADGSMTAVATLSSPVTPITGAAGYIKVTVAGVASFIPFAQ